MTTPQDTPREVAARALGRYGGQWDWAPGSTHAAVRQCRNLADDVLAALTAAGYRIIRTDAAEHGDTLEQVGWRGPTGGFWSMRLQVLEGDEEFWTPAFALRRVVGNEQETPDEGTNP